MFHRCCQRSIICTLYHNLDGCYFSNQRNPLHHNIFENSQWSEELFNQEPSYQNKVNYHPLCRFVKCVDTIKDLCLLWTNDICIQSLLVQVSPSPAGIDGNHSLLRRCNLSSSFRHMWTQFSCGRTLFANLRNETRKMWDPDSNFCF